MPPITPPSSTAALLELVRQSEIIPREAVEARLGAVGELPPDPARASEILVRRGVLTGFQAKQLLAGRHKGFRLGVYVIREELGRGGMGAVYLAEHSTMRRRVALKVLRTRGQQTPVSVERFQREARAAGALDHPNIVRIYDVAQHGELHYLVMEYVEGHTLDQLIVRGTGISPSRAVGYIAQAAAGLQHAHEKGFVHRDVKPSNLILTRDGTVKLLDMGLTREQSRNTDNLTDVLDKGAVVGTADYIAPEQALADPRADARADIYSLGVTFFALVTGHPPFQGSTSQKLAQHQMKVAPDLAAADPTFPPDLARVVAKMLEKKPEDRYQSAADVIAALAPWLSADGEQKVVVGLSGIDEGSSGKLRETIASSRSRRTDPKLPPPAPAKPPGRDRRVWIGAGAVLLLALGGVALWALTRPDPVARNAPQNPGQPDPGLGAQKPPEPDRSDPRPPDAAPADPPRANPNVTITVGADGYRVRTPMYEAVIDKADGCLSSFVVAGTEFLRSGAALGAQSTARGGYFYYTKDGHQGLVKLTDIKQSSPTAIAAAGGKFSVEYEFGPAALTVTAKNATDDAVPYYVLFDSETVNDVANDKGETFSLPSVRTQAEPLDPKWRTTTWIAGPARVKLTDQTSDAATRIWGPFSEFRSQVWESVARRYNRVQFTLEPSIGEEEKVPPLSPGGVQVFRNGPSRQARTDLYEAVVDRDGYMPSLRVDGVELLRANVGVSRGVYFLPPAPPTFDVRQPAPTAVTAESDAAAVRYDFAPHTVTWTVENRSPQAVPFFVVFDTSVTAVKNGRGEWAKTPVAKDAGTPAGAGWDTTTWYAGRAKLTLTGGNRVWGPWEGSYQVWEATLAPKEKRVITAEISLTDADEGARLGALTGAKPRLATNLTLESPAEYQVFQRATKLQGEITVRGRVRDDYDRLEIRTVGRSLRGPLPDEWRELPAADKARSFAATVPTPAGGWYKVEVRALKAGKVVGEQAVDCVGVGEVFVVAGQSNSTNCGPDKLRSKSGLVASFGGTRWQPGDDPQPGVQDASTGGSCWPAFGDALAEEFQVPIGVASAGRSGTSVNEWAPGGLLCRRLIDRMKQLGPNGFRAVLWHQGESDVGMAADEYARKMTALIRETQTAGGRPVPWFVAQVSYQNPNQITSPNPRAGQKKLWETGVALEGPDTDTLTGDNRSEDGKGVHFSAKGLRAHGKMWAEKVGPYLEKELAK